MRCFSKSGNTLSEYAIIIGLLSALGVGGLSLLGNSVSDLLSGVSKGSGSHSMQGYLDSTLGTGVSGGGTAQNGIVSSTGAPIQGQVAVAGSPNGSPNNALATINPLNPLTANNTGGGTNATSVDGVGMVKSQADRLLRLMQEIQADPDHDPQVLAMITSMANSGHMAGERLAVGVEIFKQLRSTLSPEVLASGKLPTEMTSASMREAIQANATFQSSSKSLEQYLAAHPNVLSASQIGEIQAAKTDIIGIMDKVTDTTKAVDDTTALKQDGWNTLAAQSEVVHQDSNTICRNGGNQRVCVK